MQIGFPKNIKVESGQIKREIGQMINMGKISNPEKMQNRSSPSKKTKIEQQYVNGHSLSTEMDHNQGNLERDQSQIHQAKPKS